MWRCVLTCTRQPLTYVFSGNRELLERRHSLLREVSHGTVSERNSWHISTFAQIYSKFEQFKVKLRSDSLKVKFNFNSAFQFNGLKFTRKVLKL